MIQGLQFSRFSPYQAVTRIVRREFSTEQPAVEARQSQDQPAIRAAELDHAKYQQALRQTQRVEDSPVLREIE